jgi:hypothetical protein
LAFIAVKNEPVLKKIVKPGLAAFVPPWKSKIPYDSSDSGGVKGKLQVTLVSFHVRCV